MNGWVSGGKGTLPTASEKVVGTNVRTPILGDVPLLGVLFRTRTRTLATTELVICIVTRIECPRASEVDAGRRLEIDGWPGPVATRGGASWRRTSFGAGTASWRAGKLDPDDALLGYLMAVHGYRTGAYEAAVGNPAAIRDAGVPEPAVLLLADLCQEKLDDPAAAIASLVEYLQLREDPEVRARLEKLGGADGTAP